MVWKQALKYLFEILTLLVSTPILFTILIVLWMLAIGGSI